MKGSHKAFILSASMLLCACASRAPVPEPAAEPTRSGAVGMEIVPPAADTSKMALPPSQRFVYPNLIDRVVMPVYPQVLLAARLAPVDVCVDAVIGANGGVVHTLPRTDADCVRAPVRQEFVQAVTDAVRQWRFDPALLCIAPDASAEDPCLHPQMTERPTSVRLSYAFRFSQRDGAPTVERIGGD